MPYSFKVGNGTVYLQDKYREFIVKEVRSRLADSNNAFIISMIEGNNTLEMTVRCSDLYITHFGGVEIPQRLINYNESAVLINKSSIDTAFADARDFDGTGSNESHNTLRVLPFLFAEAARFPIVNFAVGKVLNSNATFKWTSFRNLIRSWQVLSNWGNSKGLVPPDAVKGGGGKFAPIEPSLIRDYNAKNHAKISTPTGVGM